MPTTDITEVLGNLKSAQQKPLGMLGKSTFTESMSATSGLTFYDLELGAKFLYPVLTPLRNTIPRVSGKGGIQANWRSITAINTQNLRFGVSTANRGGVLAVATAPLELQAQTREATKATASEPVAKIRKLTP